MRRRFFLTIGLTALAISPATQRGLSSRPAPQTPSSFDYLPDYPLTNRTHSSPYSRIEGQHIFVDLTPANLAILENPDRWLAKLDLAYEAMVEFMGYSPYQGAAIAIREDPMLTQYGLIAGNPISWNASLISPSLKSVNERDDILFGPVHEIGHDFDERGSAYVGQGPLNPELWANLKALYALDRIAERFPTTTVNVNYWDPRTYVSASDLSEWFYIRQQADPYLARDRKPWSEVSIDEFLGLLMKVRQSVGWQPFIETMHTEAELHGAFLLQEEGKLNLFLYLLSKNSNTAVAEEFEVWGFPTGALAQDEAAKRLD